MKAATMGKVESLKRRHQGATFLALTAISLIASSGCRNAEVLKGFQAKLDPKMIKAERDALVADAERLNELRFNASEASLFRAIFKGGELPSDGVLTYLDERVNYIIGSNSDVDSLLRVGPRSYRELRTEYMGAAASEDEGESRGLLMALNVGMAGWWIHESVGPSLGVSVRFDGKRIPLTTSRVGLIQLGPGYINPQTQTVERLETLVHEGRHSDCTGGLSQQALVMLRMGVPPIGTMCGHSHAACPSGHPLEGLPACDVQPWGAYSIGAVFAIAVSGQCDNCTDEEKAVAEMSAADSLSRVDPEVLDGMISGVYGAPDMTSQGLLEE